MTLIKHIKQLLTLAGPQRPRTGSEMQDLGIIQDGAVLIGEGTILACGKTEDIESMGSSVDAIDGRERDFIALPGFVDSHTHPVFAQTREHEYEMRVRGATYQQITAAGGGIRSSVTKVRQVSRSLLYEKSLRYATQFLHCGTTTLEAKSGYGLTVDDELKLLQVIRDLTANTQLEYVPTFLGAHTVPDEFSSNRERYVSLIINEMIPKVSQAKLAVFCDVFCEKGFFSVDESRRILNTGKRSGLKLKIHADELSPGGGAELAAELEACSADHLEYVSETGIEMLKKAGVIATLLPGTAFNLGLGIYPPARRLIDSGVAVALATDFNPGTCFTPNMQLILSIACSQMKMTPAETICAATINGAYALGVGEMVGSIEPGKQADLILLDLTDYRQLPYYFGVNHCKTVIKKGKLLDTEDTKKWA